jgi:hypothetical protein
MLPDLFLANLTALVWFCILAMLSWVVAFLLGYGAWIVANEIISILEDLLRVLLQIP